MRRISPTGQEQILVHYANGSRWVPVVWPISFTPGGWGHPGTVRIVCPFTGTIELHGWAPGTRTPHSLRRIDRSKLAPDEAAEYFIDCPDPDAPPPADFILPPAWEMFAERLEWYRSRMLNAGGVK